MDVFTPIKSLNTVIYEQKKVMRKNEAMTCLSHPQAS